MIVIIDYGAGNLRSVQKAVEYHGSQARVTSDPRKIEKADKIILPGVGAFGNAIAAMDRLHLRAPVTESIASGKPFLGICLGLQLLLEKSEENPGALGLGVVEGSVHRFRSNKKVPHLGWNVLQQAKESPLWQDVPDLSYYYFAHSYYIDPVDRGIVIGYTYYGTKVPVAIQKEKLFGLQFHPEKSQKWGLRILQNFIKY